MEKDYLFKLNVQPHVLEKYSGSRIETLKNELLPHIISFSIGNDIFSLTESNIQLEGDRMGFQIVRNYQDILESEEYERLIELTSELTKEYVRISREYSNKNGIHYSQEYLDKHQEAIELRKKLLEIFEELKQSQKEYSSSTIDRILEAEYDFVIMSKVGTGIDHIRKVKRISLFLEEYKNNPIEAVQVVYKFQSERLSIRARSQQEALTLHRIIERKINSSGELGEVGKVTINPIYEEIVLNIDQQNTRSIEIVTTYPNGTADELEDLMVDPNEFFKTKESRMTLMFSDDKNNRVTWRKIWNFLILKARQGYLRSVNKNGCYIIDEENSVLQTERY